MSTTTKTQPAETDRAPSAPRTVRAPRGTRITCKSWLQEAALRMLMNNLDPEVAEKPDELIVYEGSVEPLQSRVDPAWRWPHRCGGGRLAMAELNAIIQRDAGRLPVSFRIGTRPCRFQSHRG
jgi:hypothetical protein